MTGAITKAIEALEEAEGYSLGNATISERDRLRQALADLRALKEAIPVFLTMPFPYGDEQRMESVVTQEEAYQCAKLLSKAVED